MIRLLQRQFWPLIFIALSLGFAFAAGPFRSPDEFNHFFRAYEVSRGHLVAARPTAEFLGDNLPASLVQMAQMVAGYPDAPPIKTSFSQIRAGLQVSLRPSRRVFVAFPGALNSPPGVYFLPALGVGLGRLFRASPLVLLYLGRCCNALIAGGLIGWAIRRIWRDAPFVTAVALLPMCLFQVGMLTADATAFALAFAWYSEIVRTRLQTDVHVAFTRWRLLLMAAALSQTKLPYPFLGLLVVSLPFRLLGVSRLSAMRFLAAFFATLFLPCFGWLAIMQRMRVQMRPRVEVDPVAQLLFVAGHPLRFLDMVWSEITHYGAGYWHQIIGVFGWLALPVPSWILIGLTVGLGLSICTSSPYSLRLTKYFHVFSFILAMAGILATFFLIYAAWDSPGAPRIEGWQGRYAIPFLPLMGFAMANSSFRRVRWILHISLFFFIVADIAAIIYLARATYF